MAYYKGNMSPWRCGGSISEYLCNWELLLAIAGGLAMDGIGKLFG